MYEVTGENYLIPFELTCRRYKSLHICFQHKYNILDCIICIITKHICLFFTLNIPQPYNTNEYLNQNKKGKI